LIDTFAIGNPIKHTISQYYAYVEADSLHLSQVSYSEGQVRMIRKEYSIARRHLTEAVLYNPKNYPAHYELGLAVFFSQREDQESVKTDLLQQMFRYWELKIPQTETDLWARIEEERETHIDGLE